MKYFFYLLFVVLLALIVAVITGVVVLMSTGIGFLLAKVLPFSLFQATVLALVPLAAIIGLFVTTKTAQPGASATAARANLDDESDDGDESDAVVMVAAEVPAREVPERRWYKPDLPDQRYGRARRDATCPCGSGRKYRSCHGKGQAGR